MRNSERAAQIWPLLTYSATHCQSLTYEILGKLVGMPPIATTQALLLIEAYCVERGLPALTVLVVGSKSGVPGDRFSAAKDVAAEHQRVFAFEWLEMMPPKPDDFEGRTS